MSHPVATFLAHAGIRHPVVCGAMYPCSNPELVAAVSEAGGLGVLQPLSLVYVYGYDFRAGLQAMKAMTGRPIAMNVITEQSSRVYRERMEAWVDIALEEGVRFFVTSLGNPRWVVEKAHAVGGVVYHDVTERKWADKAIAAGVDGLIAVNDRAGGHAGTLSAERLIEDLRDTGLPVLCAGGIGEPADLARALELGYAGVQMGTRFIATSECKAHDDYKAALLKATADDVVLTDKVTGVPVSVIKTPFIERTGTRAGPIARALLKNRKTKHWVRMIYSLQALWKLKRSSLHGMSYGDYWQAGKSVQGVTAIESAGDIVKRFGAAAEGFTAAG